MIVCTIASANYLHKVMILAKSVKEHLASAKMVVCLLEKDLDPWLIQQPYIDEIVLAKNLDIPMFSSFLFKYGVIEGSTAVKANLLQYLFANYQVESHCIYLDPDTKVLSSFDELTQVMMNNNILFIPHQLELEGFWPSQHHNGLYNLGFIGLSRSRETDRFLSWWADRLYHYCYYSSPLFVDQKWIDLAPVYFDVHIFKHPGYNISFWNLHEHCRRISVSNSGQYMVHDKPVCFFHFSCLNSYLQSSMRYWIEDDQSAVYQLVENYRLELKNMGQDEICSKSWSYAFFESGERISYDTRIIFRNNPQLAIQYPNPYSASNSVFQLI